METVRLEVVKPPESSSMHFLSSLSLGAGAGSAGTRVLQRDLCSVGEALVMLFRVNITT